MDKKQKRFDFVNILNSKKNCFDLDLFIEPFN